ncbi:hypothetical protein [Actinomadura sp. 3N407]|uniref:hypothetical protein n=1 Tax=Actinomadura sp. 3N407 TaxID=3457423 RepID=UPI003FCD5246
MGSELRSIVPSSRVCWYGPVSSTSLPWDEKDQPIGRQVVETAGDRPVVDVLPVSMEDVGTAAGTSGAGTTTM